MTPSQKSQITKIINGYDELIPELFFLGLLDAHQKVNFEEIMAMNAYRHGIKVRDTTNSDYVLHQNPRYFAEAVAHEGLRLIEDIIYDLADGDMNITWQPYVVHNDTNYEVHTFVTHQLEELQNKIRVILA